MVLIVAFVICGLVGGPTVGVEKAGLVAYVGVSVWRLADVAPDNTAASTTNGTPDAPAAYLHTIAAQRIAVAETSATARQFLMNPNSLKQRDRTQFLRAIDVLHANADAAASLVPPPELDSLHRQHLESLRLLATVGDLYTAGMDTHDPSQYDRASRALADGTKLFDAVGSEIDRLSSPD